MIENNQKQYGEKIMELRQTVIFVLASCIVLGGCGETASDAAVGQAQVDLIGDEFPEHKAEVLALMDELKQTINAGDVDRLISFHAYGPKFTEFKNGEPRNGGEENEAHERGVFGSVTEVVKFDYDDLKVAVYGDVANVTFHSDFHLKFGENDVIVKDQITLLLVNTENGWKLVHEHHSPLKSAES